MAHVATRDLCIEPGYDLAFADTVVSADLDLEEAPPPSGIVVSDGTGVTRCLVPVPFPPRADALRPAGARSRRWLQMRAAMESARAEMRLLWSATALEEVHGRRATANDGADPFARAATLGRRIRRLFSLFEWDRADLLQAAWIALAVFVLVATVGATALRISSLP
jgi:hypothetical protein